MEHAAHTDATSSRQYRSMVNNVKGQRDPDAALVYQLRIKGHLGPQWMETITFRGLRGDNALTRRW